MKTIYYNGRVYAGELPLAQAFSVEAGRFGAVGTDAELLAQAGPEDRRVDQRGRFVCPGFNDSHMHLLNFGQTLRMADLARHTDSLAGMLDYVRTWAAEHPPRAGGWIVGRGWNQDYFADTARMPNRADLDGVSREVPVLLVRSCGHCCVVNTKALELAGVDAGTPSPEGGAIGQEDGEPDGRFYDNAMDLIYSILPAPGKEEIKDMIRLACRALNGYGITSAQSDDYCVFRAVPFETVNEAYRELEAEGELTVRVCL